MMEFYAQMVERMRIDCFEVTVKLSNKINKQTKKINIKRHTCTSGCQIWMSLTIGDLTVASISRVIWVSLNNGLYIVFTSE